MSAPSRGTGHVLSKAGFFDFSHCRLFPLEYRLPARFETIPSRPSSQALANTSAPWAYQGLAEQNGSTPATSGESAARRSSIGRCRKSSPLRSKRSKQQGTPTPSPPLCAGRQNLNARPSET